MTMTSRLEWNGVVVTGRMREGGVKGLKLAAEHVLQKSREVVPLEEGTLERSAVASVDELTLEGAVSYDTEYAVYQHERLDLQHAPGRHPKYLEDTLVIEAQTCQEIIAAQIRRSLR